MRFCIKNGDTAPFSVKFLRKNIAFQPVFWYIYAEISGESRMLTSFSVKNFKNFEKKFTIDLSNTKQYAYSEACVKDGIVKTGLIYGPNSIGKSNLGKAIFDIVQTDEKYMGFPVFKLRKRLVKRRSSKKRGVGDTQIENEK